MRRLPVYFVIDVSESMVGEPIAQVEEGMRAIIQELRSDPYALETVFVGILVFAGKPLLLTPLTELYKFYPPAFPIGSGTSLGEALRALMREMDTSVQKTTMQAKGDWKPLIFLFTDGAPTDQPDAAIDAWNAKYRRQCSLIAVALGEGANLSHLHALTPDVLRLKDATPEAFKQFFKWVTASIKTTSASATEGGQDGAQLAPIIDGISLEKVDGNTLRKAGSATDENFAVLLAKCSTNRKPFLIKYTRRMRLNLDDVSTPQHITFDQSAYRLMGAYPIDEGQYQKLSAQQAPDSHISSDSLIGTPTCPCCGNQLGRVLCDCGNIHCAEGKDGETVRCPWCGTEGMLMESESALDFSRRQG